MSIHAEHPFLTPEPDRDPVRRARGRLSAPVTIWASGQGKERAGLTVSSMIIAEGDPGEVIGLVNPESGLGELLAETRTVAVTVLGGPHRRIGDVFAGVTPSPGGKFRTGNWTQTEWGPVADGAPAWIGARLLEGEPEKAGWAYLVRARIEKVQLADLVQGDQALGYLRGRYRFLDWES
ncbi:flavin reductase [Microlunatus elymi]|uniref:Flavin reductase n=1 Tax=Microlunatus elymi TaxID=2596828 RepID=A0A516Q2A4_9ACTN|nr:flavin reductase family protein [Microlunatus elymi]QDP97341.1 flavin reductase [Microlunatus elymi]